MVRIILFKSEDGETVILINEWGGKPGENIFKKHGVLLFFFFFFCW